MQNVARSYTSIIIPRRQRKISEDWQLQLFQLNLHYGKRKSSLPPFHIHDTSENVCKYNASVTCRLSCLDEELLLLRDREEIFCDMAEPRSSELILLQVCRVQATAGVQRTLL